MIDAVIAFGGTTTCAAVACPAASAARNLPMYSAVAGTSFQSGVSQRSTACAAVRKVSSAAGGGGGGHWGSFFCNNCSESISSAWAFVRASAAGGSPSLRQSQHRHAYGQCQEEQDGQVSCRQQSPASSLSPRHRSKLRSSRVLAVALPCRKPATSASSSLSELESCGYPLLSPSAGPGAAGRGWGSSRQARGVSLTAQCTSSCSFHSYQPSGQ